SARVRWLVDYACRDDYGLTANEASAWAGLFYFASRMRRPGAESQPLITWPEGNGRLIKHLYERTRARVRLGLAVADVRPSKGEKGRGPADVERRGVEGEGDGRGGGGVEA